MAIELYPIHSATARPEFSGAWEGPVWQRAPAVEIAHFRPESSDHRPRTQAKLLWRPEGIYGLFRVQDRYVRCVYRRFQDPVYKDSCVEFFVQPRGQSGYFNFEFNCGGNMLASYVLDPSRTEDGFKQYTCLAKSEFHQIRVFHSQPKTVEPEIQSRVVWFVEFFIPFRIIAKYVGLLNIEPGMVWYGNLYKCGDETSHPHWAAWSPVDALDFHLPRCFGEFHFMPSGGDLSTA